MVDLKHAIEALLFSSGRAMSEEALASVAQAEPKDVRAVLKTLHDEYAASDRAIKIFNENDTWRMLVRDDCIEVVRRVVADTELSRPVMETLAVVAFHYPKILQSEVIKTRGAHAYEHIKELEEAGFMTRTKEGRSFSIKLTEKFFEYFDIEGADDIKEFFKGVEVPKVPEEQQKLGDMDVVSTGVSGPEADPKDQLDGMQVVDVDDNPFMARHLGNKPEVTEEEREEERGFLDKIDDEIDTITTRNEAHDKDDSFKFKVSSEDEYQEGTIEEMEEKETPEAATDYVAELGETADDSDETIEDAVDESDEPESSSESQAEEDSESEEDESSEADDVIKEVRDMHPQKKDAWGDATDDDDDDDDSLGPVDL